MPLKAYAVKSTPEAYAKMLEVVKALRAANLPLPEAVTRFFRHEPIDLYERRTSLQPQHHLSPRAAPRNPLHRNRGNAMSTLIIRALSHDPQEPTHDPQELAHDLQLLSQICCRWGIPEPGMPLFTPQVVYHRAGGFHTLRLAGFPAGTTHLAFDIAP